MEELPEFEYLERLGGGEFGTVFLCRSRLSGELRAVKHISLDNPADVAAWRTEAQALAACENDHVVTIHHSTATTEGPVLVMEHLAGGDAQKRWLPEGGPVGDVVDCLLDATWGLQHLHNAGLLHRDIKPANLLFNAEGRAVIGDFGLAGGAGTQAAAAYVPHLPPEVLGGGNWTRLADVYALAVTAWRLLGAPAMPATLPEVEQALRAGTWPDRAVWPLHVHRGLRRHLRAAMHRDPAKRPQSAQHFRENLLSARPRVNFRKVSPWSWTGTDSESNYEVNILAKDAGWTVGATRDRGQGARRLAPDAAVAKLAEARSLAGAILEMLATSGPASLRRRRG